MPSSPNRTRPRAADALRQPGFKHLYTAFLIRALPPIWHRLCDSAPKRSRPWATFRAALTWRLYDRALLIAVAYPIFALIGVWMLTGADGRLGPAIILPGNDSWWSDRGLTLIQLIILTAGLIGRQWAKSNRHRVVQQAADWILITAVAFAVAIEWLDQNNRPRLARLGLTLLLPLGWVAALIFAPWSEVSDTRRAMFLFLGVFPLINALFDVISYAVTLTTLRLGLRRWNPMLASLVDLACAVLLFLGLGITLTAVIAGMNALSGVTFLDLPALFRDLPENPGDHLWVFLMLFSTILPTGIHLMIAATLGAQSLMIRPLRRRLAGLSDQAADTGAPFAPVVAPPIIAALATIPFAAVGGIIWAILTHWPALLSGFGGWYFALLKAVAGAIPGAL